MDGHLGLTHPKLQNGTGLREAPDCGSVGSQVRFRHPLHVALAHRPTPPAEYWLDLGTQQVGLSLEFRLIAQLWPYPIAKAPDSLGNPCFCPPDWLQRHAMSQIPNSQNYLGQLLRYNSTAHAAKIIRGCPWPQ